MDPTGVHPLKRISIYIQGFVVRKWIPFQIATERTELLAVLVKFDCVETIELECVLIP